jgi:hypothetical protein
MFAFSTDSALTTYVDDEVTLLVACWRLRISQATSRLLPATQAAYKRETTRSRGLRSYPTAMPEMGLPSQTGPVNLAAALRHHARDLARPLTTLGITNG